MLSPRLALVLLRAQRQAVRDRGELVAALNAIFALQAQRNFRREQRRGSLRADAREKDAGRPLVSAHTRQTRQEWVKVGWLRALSAQTPKISFRDLLRLAGVAEYLFANDPFRSFLQVIIERILDLQELRPESAVEERSWSPQANRRIALTRVPIGFQTIAAAQRGEQSSVPMIQDPELHLYWLFNLRCGGKGFSHPLDRRCRCISFAIGGGAFEERGYLAQFLSEFLFSGH